MKNNNYYEVLGVAPHVGAGQIQAAYRFARGLYSGEALASYGLLDAEERTQMLALVETAYATLSNPNGRREHDLSLETEGEVGAPAPVSAPRAKASETRAASLAAAPAPAPDPSATTASRVPDPPATSLSVPEVVNGAALRALREARNLSLDQIAALSKVGSRFLLALEEDRHKVLPARVFARGFLIEYARALSVSEVELVERYLKHWRGN